MTYTKGGVSVSKPVFFDGDPAVMKKFDIRGYSRTPEDTGIYITTITAEIPIIDANTGSNWSTSASWEIDAWYDACDTDLTVNNSIVSEFPTITYTIGDSAHVETFDNTINVKVTSNPDIEGEDCGDIQLSLINDCCGGTIDASVFTWDSGSRTLTTLSTDFGKRGTYTFELSANVPTYENAESSASITFSIELVDVCFETTLSIASSILTGTLISYTVTESGHDEFLDSTLGNAVTASPSVSGYGCPAIVFTFDDQSGGAMDASVFTYDDPTEKFTIFTTNLSKAGDHLGRVKANFDGYT